jgi:hypothetical protein
MPLKLVDGRPTPALQDMPSVRYRPIELALESEELVVYRCFDTLLGRPVALHVAQSGEDPALQPVDFFARGQALADLGVEGVPEIHEYGYHRERPYLVLPLPRGRQLAELVADGRRLAPVRILAVGLRVALALEALHGAGQVHAGLAVNTLLVDRSGKVSLTDLGLLRDMGRPFGQEVWSADDVRQLGVVLMSLSLGSQDDGEADPAFEAPMQALIDRMIAPEPADRPAAAALVDELTGLLTDVELPEAPWAPSLPAMRSGSHRVTSTLQAFALPPEQQPPPPPPMPEVPASMLAAFINTVSLTSARWGIGKRKPEVVDLRGLMSGKAGVGKKATPKPATPQAAVAPTPRSGGGGLLLTLLLTVALVGGWALLRSPDDAADDGAAPAADGVDVAPAAAGSEPTIPEPAPVAIAREEPAPAPEPTVEVEASGSATPTVAAPTADGEPEVVRFRDGQRVDGPPPEDPYDKATIPEHAEPVTPARPAPRPVQP